VRGKDIARWSHKTELFVVVANRSPRKEDQISESDMRRLHPKTFEYFYLFKTELLHRGKLWAFYGKNTDLKEIPKHPGDGYFQRKRTTSVKSGAPVIQTIDVPFYAMRDVGDYSFANFKVVWQMGATEIKSVVLEPERTLIGTRPVLPCTGTVSYVACQSRDEAHYICASLNSDLANAFFRSFSSAGRGMGAPSILKQIKLPRFDGENAIHRKLAELSGDCHEAAISKKADVLDGLEAQVNANAARMWGVTVEEQKRLLV